MLAATLSALIIMGAVLAQTVTCEEPISQPAAALPSVEWLMAESRRTDRPPQHILEHRYETKKAYINTNYKRDKRRIERLVETDRMTGTTAANELTFIELDKEKKLLELDRVYELRVLDLEDEIDRLQDVRGDDN